MCGERHVANQLLVSVDEGEDLETAVEAVLNDKTLLKEMNIEGPKTLAEALGLTRRSSDLNDPPGIAIIDSQRNLHYRFPPHSLMQHCRREGIHMEDLLETFASLSPNFTIVQMSHGRFLPISYPRPTTPPDAEKLRFPTDERPEKHVQVAVIDSPILLDSQLTGIQGGGIHLDPSKRVTVAELHGTAVAGLVRLLEPRASVELVAMRDADTDGFYSDHELARQIMNLANRPNPPDIISCSLGSVVDAGSEPVATKRAVEVALRRGIHIFAAAGNDGDDRIVYPGLFDGVHVVGAQTFDPKTDTPRAARFTNGSSSPGSIDFWAAGVDVRSFGPGTPTEPVTLSFKDGPHSHDSPEHVLEETLAPADMLNVEFAGGACWSGCSMAVPIVAAACATLLIDAPGDTPASSGPDPDPIIDELRGLYGAENNTTSYDESGSFAVELCNQNGQVTTQS